MPPVDSEEVHTMNSHNGHGKILVVDDTFDRLEMMNVLLQSAGYHVLTASDGREAFEVAQRKHPNLVISDVSMPHIDGIELSRMLRADAQLSLIPVLLVSAMRKDTASTIEGLHSGAFDYLQAPYDPPYLLAKIKR